MRVLGEVLQVRTREVEDREAKSRKELLERISHLENALESERDNRRQWSNARVQLLQEFCQEEGKLREVIGSNNINNNDDDKAANLYYGNHDVEDDFDYLNISQSTPKKNDLNNTINTPSPTRAYPNFGTTGSTLLINSKNNNNGINPMQMAQTSASVLTALGKAHVRNTIHGGGGGGDMKFRKDFNNMRKGGGGGGGGFKE